MNANRLEAAPLPIKGAFLIKPFEHHDARGAFFQVFTESVLEEINAAGHVSNEFFSISKKGVVRGLHYQSEPYAQGKLVTCLRGKAYDVIVDLRESSPTFGKWASAELSEKNGFTVYVPRGCAHGFLALENNTLMLYGVDNRYSPSHECGVIFDDPALAIKWPLAGAPTLSERDKKWPSFKECRKFD